MPLLLDRMPIRRSFQLFLGACTVLGLAALMGLASPARSADVNDPTRGDLVLFPGPLQEQTLPRTPGMPAGNASRPVVMGLNIPGRNFRAGEGWWGLVCGAQPSGCQLVLLRLAVTPATHPVYDSEPTPSQILSWSPLPASLSAPDSKAKLLAVFKPIRALAKLPLAVGPVKTWLHAAMDSYPPGGRIGSMEVSIPVVPGAPALLLPRLQPGKEGRSDGLLLELRQGGRRQLLDGFDPVMEGPVPVRPTDYLLWAGDLDGDGKPDLLVDLSGGMRKVKLYLSSLATGQELVGEAGSFEFVDPSSAGC